jgi:hypothetical protein
LLIAGQAGSIEIGAIALSPGRPLTAEASLAGGFAPPQKVDRPVNWL